MAKAEAKGKSEAKKPPSKSEILAAIAEATGLSKKDVGAVIEAMSSEIKKALSNKGAGAFTVPGLMKITKTKVPARPAQKGVKNPFTGELQDRPARPAFNRVKVRALKSLKEMVS